MPCSQPISLRATSFPSQSEIKKLLSGIDGNYGARQTIYQVNPRILDHLKELDPKSIDILLLHVSPINVQKSSVAFPLAQKILAEIERLQPKIVLSGHTNIFSGSMSQKNVRFVNLQDMAQGYSIVTLEDDCITFERKKAVYS